MRRAATVLATTLTLLALSTPAYAYAHDRVTNPYLHALLDTLTLAVVTAPVWTAFIWARRRHTVWLLSLISLIQAPAAVLAFVPVLDPTLHAVALLASLGVTVSSIVYVRREVRAQAPAVTR